MRRLERATRWWAWRFATAYAGVRAARLLQSRGVLPGEGGLLVRGRHVHHYAYGGTLLGSQALVSLLDVSGGVTLRRNLVCLGAALVADEFDLVLRCEQSRWAQGDRRLVDAALVMVPLSAHVWVLVRAVAEQGTVVGAHAPTTQS